MAMPRITQVSEPITLLVCGNGAWSAHITTTLLSAQRATPTTPIRVLIGAVEIDESDRERIQSAIPESPITWIEISMAELDALPERRTSKFNFIELLALNRLPLDIERVLTIDADAIVLDELGSLWDTDLDGHTLAAARCTWGLWIGRGIRYFEELGLDGNAKYLQGGVKLIDMESWRRNGIHERSMAHLNKWHDSMHLGEQEILNSVIDDDWLELPLRWNVTTERWTTPDLVACAFSQADLEESRINPGIFHFAGAKPWDWTDPLRGDLPWLEEWEQYAFDGPYRNWYVAERERGLAQRAAIRPQRRSPLRRLRKVAAVLRHG
jgi:lipopolysaccharide biosynthesis glycosyltransferase